MANKNMIIALVLSFIWSGLGLIYAEDMQKGIMLAVVAVICYILMYFVSPIFGMVVFIVWIYSIYATYKQVKVVNGEWEGYLRMKDIFPNLIFKTMKNNTKK